MNLMGTSPNPADTCAWQDVNQLLHEFVNTENHLAHLALRRFQGALEGFFCDFRAVADFVDE